MGKTQKDGKTNSKISRIPNPRITKKDAQRYLARVPEQNVFWCNDGHVLRSIDELKDALAMMTDQTFYYHSNNEKKDFSNWIRDVVGDVKLAQILESAPDRENAARIVEERCSVLMSKAG